MLRRIYRGFTVEIIGRQKFVVLIELEMLNFVINMGFDWLASCYDNVEY